MRVLVFGANGALGAAICQEFQENGHEVITGSRTAGTADLVVTDKGDIQTSNLNNFDACVWAQ